MVRNPRSPTRAGRRRPGPRSRGKSRPAAPATDDPPKFSLALAAALLLVCGVAVYYNSLQGVYLFDDMSVLTAKNPHLRSLWPITEAIKSPKYSTAEGRPVLALSFAVSYALGGLEPRGQHLFNLGVHLCCGLTLLGLVRRTFCSPRLDARYRGQATLLGFAVALLWLLHPLNTKAVTYVIQRAESLMGLFYLLTLYCAIRGMSSGRWRWYAGSVAACLLGLGTKEVTATAPLLVLLYDRIFFSASWRELLQRRWGLYASLAATWLLLALILTTVSFAESSGFTPWVVGPLEYAQTQCWAIARYLRLSLLPVGLVFDYGSPEVGRLLTRIQLLFGGAVLAAALLATAAALRWRPAMGFLGICFLGILAPTSSLMPMDAEFAAEHRMYLPLAAVVTVLVLGAHTLWQRLGSTTNLGRALVLVLLLAAGALGGLTHLRNRDYHSTLAIWSSSIRSWPQNPRAHYNRGNAHARAQRHELAIRNYDRAIQILPDHADAHLSRGMVQEVRGDHAQAIASYSRTVEITRRRRAAGRRGVRALSNDNIESLALNGWAWVLATSPHRRFRDGTRAVTLARRANELSNGKSAAMLDTLAAAHAEAGQFDRAAQVIQKAITITRSRADKKTSREYQQRLKSYLRAMPHRDLRGKPVPTTGAGGGR